MGPALLPILAGRHPSDREYIQLRLDMVSRNTRQISVAILPGDERRGNRDRDSR